ncbi:tetratricopeptide repeat protein [Patescibacteria group bacterium]|nr:tetratricopeptide repeat protein [Patescibacteria group bacterium]
MLPTILIIIIFLCLVIIGAVIFKKIPKVLAIDAKSKILKQPLIKRRLLEERLERHFKEGGKKMVSILEPPFNNLGTKFKKLYQKLIELEEKYRHKVLKVSFKEGADKERKVESFLDKAAELVSSENFDEAEKIYIETLTLDEKNIPAYKGLGELYLLKKDYEHAKETFEFLLKLEQDDPFVYRGLGEIAAEKGDLKVAEEDYLKSLEIDKEDFETHLKLAEIYLNLEDYQKSFKLAEEAVVLEPHNPRALDFLIEISIILRDKATALKIYRQLKEVNPDNQKLPDFRKRIDQL